MSLTVDVDVFYQPLVVVVSCMLVRRTENQNATRRDGTAYCYNNLAPSHHHMGP